MPQVLLEETLTRYITQRNHIRRFNNTVRHSAFLPNREGKTSIFRTSNTTNEAIWDIGNRYVVPSRGPILGRADLTANIVIEKDLQIVPHEPPEKHANIIGWPEEKSKQMQIAMELAAAADFKEL